MAKQKRSSATVMLRVAAVAPVAGEHGAVAEVLAAASGSRNRSPSVQPSQGTPTRSPGPKRSPPATTVPTIWWPSTSGSLGSRQLAVDDVQVGATDPAGRHLQQQLAVAGLRAGQILLAKRLARAVEHHRPHGRRLARP